MLVKLLGTLEASRMDKRKLSETASWVLVLCALLTTGIVVRREFSAGATVDAEKREATLS